MHAVYYLSSESVFVAYMYIWHYFVVIYNNSLTSLCFYIIYNMYNTIIIYTMTQPSMYSLFHFLINTNNSCNTFLNLSRFLRINDSYRLMRGPRLDISSPDYMHQ